MAEIQTKKPITNQIQQLLQKLQMANALTQHQPLAACQEFMQITVNVDELAEKYAASLSADGLQTLAKIQNTASDNLIQAALMATPTEDLEDIIPLIENRLDRLNNLINLGFYLQENQTQVRIKGQIYTALTCAQKAQKIDPAHEMTLALIATLR